MIITKLSSRTIEFVLARQKDDGGFGATPHLPSTVEDTYYALSLLDMLRLASNGREEFRERITRSAQYLEGVKPQDNWNPKTFYYYLLGRSIAGLKTGPEILNFLHRSRRDDEWALEDLYYLCKATNEVGLKPLDAEKLWAPKVDFTQWRTAKELWLKLSVAELTGTDHRPNREDAIGWIVECQNPDGGFGFYPGATSFIENTHICLALLTMLNASPSDPMAARDFILRCRTGRGGFARKNGGAPFLDATWHAISSLKLISGVL